MNINKEYIIDFLSSLEGYHQMINLIHWSTEYKSEHLLTDEIDSAVLTFEDEIAEISMGMLKERITSGLKSLISESKNLINLLTDLENDILELKKKINNDVACCGLENCCDDFLQKIKKWQYLATFK